MKRGVTVIKSYLLVSILLMLGYSFSLHAEKMDLEAHDLVIEKLESSLNTISSNDQNIDSIGLRLQLANLYSDKARLLLIEEGHRPCDNCLKSKQFRQKAINLYKGILGKLNGNESDQVSLQLAHLLETTDQSKEALNIYNNLISKNNSNKKTLAQAYSKRAGNYFADGKFDQALADFQVVLKMSPEQERGATLHKIAWAYYNKGEIDLAIAKLLTILKNETLLKQSTEEGYQYSEGFHSEVAHDLALFMAKNKITSTSLDQLVAVSPREDVISNLLYLGDEAERVGQTEGAPLAWERALKMEGFPSEKKLPVLISIARYHRDNFRYPKANNFFLQALELAQSTYGSSLGTEKCEAICAEHSRSLKQFLTQWEKQAVKLTKPQGVKDSQMALIQAYEIYHKFQNNDYETQLWLGQLSQKIKQREPARKAYSRAADLIANSANKDSASSKKLLESSLLAEIELAESSSNPTYRFEAYEHYLKLNPTGPASASVRYQRAKLFYDQGKVDRAYALFDEIVSDEKFTKSDLKLKSAHLALDSLVLLKEIETLEQKSLEYGTRFPKERTEFHKISRKAGLQIVRLLATKKASVSEAEKALAKLETVTMHGSDANETKSYLRMKIDLATKAQNWESAQLNITKYLARTDLTESEKAWAFNKRLAMAELLLDFRLAYQTILKLNLAKSSSPKDLLKGALLAELNKADARPWLEKVIISKAATREQIQLAKAQLIRLAKNPWKALHTHASSLSSYPSLMAGLALECFDQDANFTEARWVLGIRGVKSTWAGQTLQRILSLNDLQIKAQAVSQLRLNSRTDVLIASTLRQRMKSLADLKNSLRAAQRQQDWTLQVIAAALLRNENQRLAKDIELLPIPKRLNESERKMYSNELIAQASPFKKTAAELDLFLTSSWQDERYINLLLQKIEINDRIRSLLMNELRSLAAFAPASLVKNIKAKLAEFKSRPTNKEITSTQDELRKDPFDLGLQEQLISMEKKRGNQSMVVFLQARINSIKGGQL